ncbi:globin family protein [Rhodoferax sp.]|uniref:globin family protein n=1 Tax=Rhodoferax sp. TaxID=50421 RepID=UPI001ED261F5|nr:globin family protein [Rhodoferax sp.]MBT9505644.1 hemin receptor [Rhodoferax sp.]
MNSEQIQLVQSTFNSVRPIAGVAAQLFYDQLFELDPSLRSLFKGDITRQGQMLMSMLGTAVNGLSKLETLVPVVHQLGIRHAGYGVRTEHYDTVGSALLWTLEKGLGNEFTPAARAAWTVAYALLAQTMQAGAHEAETAMASS